MPPRALLPRWLLPRAARLSAALLEATLEVRGHRGLRERLASPRFASALFAGVGLSPGAGEEVLAQVLARGLRGEEKRLGLIVEERATLGLVGGGRVRVRTASAAPQEEASLETRLGAALLLSYGPLPGPLAPLFRAPGAGPRAALALTLLSDLAFAESPSPSLLGLALGSVEGDPYGVPLVVYDRVLVLFERMLHRSPRRGFRLDALATLFFELERTAPHVRPASLERFIARERRLARRFCAFTRLGPVALDGARAPRMPKRPAPRTLRLPATWQPPRLSPPGEARALDDLFLP